MRQDLTGKFIKINHDQKDQIVQVVKQFKSNHIEIKYMKGQFTGVRQIIHYPEKLEVVPG